MSTWPQWMLRYDGTFAGFLTCVGESFQQRRYPFYFLTPGETQVPLYPLREIPSDPGAARAVYRALQSNVSATFRRMITYGFLTCLTQRERKLFDLIYLAFHHALPQDPTDDRVLLLTRGIQALLREADHYRGFVRFADYNGVLVGEISPKNRVLPLLRLHFCRRLPEESFLLYDRTHKEGLFSTGGTWKIRPVDRLDLDRPSQAEAQCQALWRRFCSTVAIPARHNPALQQTCLPLRFREHMTEFQPEPVPLRAASLP